MFVLAHLRALRDTRDKEIVLALEPEPGCLLETTDEVCRFFEEMAFPAELSDLIGVCYDCCHQAVEFEEPQDSLARLADAGIRIAKVQVSSALSLMSPAVAQLAQFDEPCYLHQVSVRRRDGALYRFRDLPDAIAEHSRLADAEWRCHFHVPIFSPGAADFGTTRRFLEQALPLLPGEPLLEVETYTFDVLPPELRRESVTDSIIRELQWLEAQVDAAYRRP